MSASEMNKWQQKVYSDSRNMNMLIGIIEGTTCLFSIYLSVFYCRNCGQSELIEFNFIASILEKAA